MKKVIALCAVAAMLILASSAHAIATPTTITIIATPDMVPDEQLPRINYGDAPTGFETDSWQGPETGKSNFHVRYAADGDLLSVLFPEDAATLTLADIESISYWTKRPDGTLCTRDWWIQIYTRPDGVNDAKSWYGYKFTNNYNEHTATGVWTLYSTDSGMTFSLDGSATEYTMAQLNSLYASELINMISVQTDSGWNGFDGCIDGLTITLKNGNVGIVNFEAAVPEPATMLILGLGAVLCGRIRKA